MDYNTLKELYANSVKENGEKPCSSMYQGEKLTYNDFADRLNNLTRIFYDAGLRKGNKIALLSNNMPNWAVCYFAAVSAGMVIVPILPDFSGPELGMIMAHADVKALCVSDKLFSKVPKETIDSLDLVIRTKNLGVISRKKGEDAEEELPSPLYEDPSPDDIAAIIYTSGTTSAPKGVMLTHSNLATQIQMECELFPIYPDDIFLSILPLSHTYECSIGMLLPFSAGSQVIYLDKLPTPSTLMPAMKAIRPTIMLSVPLIIEKIYRSQIASRFNKSKFMKKLYGMPFFRRIIHKFAGRKLIEIFGGRLRFFGIGGAKLDADTELFLKESGGFPYSIGYGLTETAPLIAGAVPGKVPFQSTGPVLNRIKYRLERVNPLTGEGEIVVLSPSTMKGYYKNPEATASVFTEDGWFRTKDLGMIDEEGNLYIKGRLDNMILGAGGENIYPEEIESVLNSHFLVTDSIVTEDSGKLVAMVHFNKEELEKRYKDFKEGLSSKMGEIKNEIMSYVNSKVSKASRISDVEEQRSEFEKTPTQKIKRFQYSLSRNKNKGEKDSAEEKKE